LTCSTSEMAFRGGTGVRIDLSKVPRRAANLTPYEMMLSESQERMLLVSEPAQEQEVLDVFKRWGVSAVSIGVVTDDGRLRIDDGGECVADMPFELLVDGCPIADRPTAVPPKPGSRETLDLGGLSPAEVLERVVVSPNVCDKRWVFEQYDHLIGTNTVIGPGSDAAVLRIKGTTMGIALSLDGDGRKTALDPYQGGVAAVAEAYMNVCCAGAQPLAITNCLNFGNPQNPKIMREFAESVRGIRDACEFLGVPVTGGNVSFYNETLGEQIYPTPVIGMVGLLEDVRKAIGLGFRKKGDQVILIGKTEPDLGASELARIVSGKDAGILTPIDLTSHKRISQALLHLIGEGLLSSCHDCSLGGLAVALLKSCFGSRYDCPSGLSAVIPADVDPIPWLFAESASRAIISLAPENIGRVTDYLDHIEIDYLLLGEVGQDAFVIKQRGNHVLSVDSRRLKQRWASSLDELLAVSSD
ncbi:MAG: phosphoribosylformylglycinamidine synthase II, partial [Candidatus Coatesbacteria bacterium]|nr:phosphoribosylformylglycinamidine synthase II [Candidatus Coatesbacteria bacterium]